jgi:hypothetical protein
LLKEGEKKAPPFSERGGKESAKENRKRKALKKAEKKVVKARENKRNNALPRLRGRASFLLRLCAGSSAASLQLSPAHAANNSLSARRTRERDTILNSAHTSTRYAPHIPKTSA